MRTHQRTPCFLAELHAVGHPWCRRVIVAGSINQCPTSIMISQQPGNTTAGQLQDKHIDGKQVNATVVPLLATSGLWD